MKTRYLVITAVALFFCIGGFILGGWWMRGREGRSQEEPGLQSERKPYNRELAKAGAAQAYDLKRRGRWVEAIPALEAALREYPEHFDSYHGLAQAKRELSDFASALMNHDLAIQLDPGRWDLYWDRGETYLRMKNYDAAIADFAACLEKNRDFGRGYRSLGQAYRGKDDFQKALMNHEQSIALEPDNPSYYRERGNTYQKMGERQLAEADFSKERELRQKAR